MAQVTNEDCSPCLGGGWEGKSQLDHKNKAHLQYIWSTYYYPLADCHFFGSNFLGVSDELPDKLLFTIRSQTNTWMCAARSRQMMRKAAETHMDVNLLVIERSYSIWIPISTGVCYSERSGHINRKVLAKKRIIKRNAFKALQKLLINDYIPTHSNSQTMSAHNKQ